MRRVNYMPQARDILARSLSILSIAVFSLLIHVSAAAQDTAYQIVDYPGAYATSLTGINDAGRAVGYYLPSLFDPTPRAFIYENGTYSTIDVPNAEGPTEALSITDDGQILIRSGCDGSSPDGCTTSYYVYDGDKFSTIGLGVSVATPQQYASLAGIQSMNDSGVAFAYYYDSNLVSRSGYVIPEVAPGSLTPPYIPPFPLFTEIDCPAGYQVANGALNDAGTIIGNCLAGLSSSFGFVYSKGSLTKLGTPSSGTYSGISNNGKYYVGTVRDPEGAFGFEAVASSYFLVAPEGSTSSSALGVNNSNQTIGDFFDGKASHGFISGPPTQPLKLLGCGCDGAFQVGLPIDVASGDMSEHAVDYTTAGQNPLAFVRHYNSRGNAPGVKTLATSLGVNWRSNYDRFLQLSAASVIAERADGQELKFALTGGMWKPDNDADITLTHSGSSWTLVDHEDTQEIYKAVSSTEAILESVETRNGYLQTLDYNSAGQLKSVTDSYGRSLEFTYRSGLIETLLTPDKTTLTFGYANPTGSAQLITVSYDTDPVTSIGYQYKQSGLPFALTGIFDENGKIYASWTYDKYGRGTSSQRAGGEGRVSLAYNSDGTTTVTNAFGVADTYSFVTSQGVPKVSSISRAEKGSIAAAAQSITYDGNGFLASKTDRNGNKTLLFNNPHGQPTSIFEAYGSPVQRLTAIIYDSEWVHLPATVTTAGVTTTFQYDGSGELLKKTLTDTTRNTAPYSTSGQARSWANTWSNHLLTSIETPNKNRTSFGYDGSGALTSTTDPLGHVTKITAHTGGGLPETVTDPNGVTTTLKYSPRQWLTSSTVSGAAGSFTTTFGYDPTGNLTRTTQPDNSYIANAYDNAHRLIKITDALGNYTSFTLDALDDRTQSNIYASGGTLARKHSGTFDDLGRLLVDAGGAGQTTTRTYDPEGNALSAKDGLGHTTTNAYDALNRLSTTSDANGGITTTTYDTHDRIIGVKDANGNTTSYVRDGFGDVIQQTSPDSGKTVYRYDADGNRTQQVDAAGVTTNRSYDALDRILTTTYPADTADNVTYNYDQTGTGFSFGIGRLTSVKDTVGMLNRAYDERGNLLAEKRTHGTVTLKTSYSYDGASRIASITYPSGTLVTYSRDAAGQVTKIAKPTATVASSITHLAFGPASSFTYGNGVTDKRSFDLDYRVTSLTDTASDTSKVQSLVYGYDLASNLTAITDNVRTGDTQAITYDPLNRLKTAVAADYGTFSYTYDKVGNRLTEGRGGEAPTNNYSYVAGTNRLSGISINGTPIENFTYTPTGNIVDFMGTGQPRVSLSYNKANRVGTIAENGTQIVQYTYDGFGQRLVKTFAGTPAAGTLFAYAQDGSLLEESSINGAAQADYIYLDGTPVGDLAPASKTLYYLHTDHLGTPQVATNGAKATAWKATYEPFGWGNSVEGTITQNLRLPGQYFDSETTSYHNGFRDYVAVLGRYGQSDPIGLAGGKNEYTFDFGNPLKFVDISGLEPRYSEQSCARFGFSGCPGNTYSPQPALSEGLSALAAPTAVIAPFFDPPIAALMGGAAVCLNWASRLTNEANSSLQDMANDSAADLVASSLPEAGAAFFSPLISNLGNYIVDESS